MQLDYTSVRKAKTVVPQGVYDFEITAAKRDISSVGNDMITLTVTIKDAAGTKHELIDWFGAWSGGAKKIVQFSRATGREHILTNKELKASDLLKAQGSCVVAVKPPHDGYGESNEIKAYLPGRAAQDKADA